MIIKTLVCAGAMAVIAIMLLAVTAVFVQNGLFPAEQHSVISYVIHFISAYLGCLICCGTTKEKKGICAGVGTAVWYIALLFVSVVLLECNAVNVLSTVVVGLCGYGAALISCLLPKSKRKTRRPKYHPR